MTKKNSYCPECKQNKKNADRIMKLYKIIREVQSDLGSLDYLLDDPVARVKIAEIGNKIRDGYNSTIS